MRKILYGTDKDLSLDKELFLLLTISSFFLLFFGLLASIYIGLGIWLILFTFLSIFIDLFFYFNLRKDKPYEKLKIYFIITTFIFFCFGWFLNGGINGTVLNIILAYFLGLYSISNPKLKPFTLVLTILMILFLLPINYFYPNFVIDYESRAQRFLDVGLGSIIFILFIYSLLELIFRSYDSKQKLLKDAKLNYEILNKELILKNQEVDENYKALKVSEENLRSDNQLRRVAERKLKSVTEMQTAILNFADYSIISTRVDGILTSFNKKAEELLGYSADELIGKFTPEKFHDKAEVLERAKEYSDELGISIEPGFDVFVAKTKLGMVNREEWNYVRKNGSKFPVTLSITALRDENQNITGFISIGHDISERKNAELKLEEKTKELKESETKYKNIFDKSKYPMLLIDENQFVDCNIAALKILKFESKEEIFKIHPSIISPEFQPDGKSSFEKAEEMMNIARKTGNHIFEWVHKRKDGSVFYAEVSLTIIPFQGRELIHTTWRDITESKKMLEDLIKAKNEAENATKLKSEFLAQMSHEIRSPMNTITSFTNLMEDILSDSEDEDIKTCFSGINTSSNRIIRTIDSILNMSELQLGTYEFLKSKIDLVDLINKLTNEYHKLAMIKNLEIIAEIKVSDAIIESDDYALTQIIANLIDNSIKYTKEGFVKVILDEDIENFIIQVEDSGIGISPEYLPNLFEPFTQEEQGYSRRFDGNGLGMSLVKKYSELLNGNIHVESEQNVGTKFTLSIPK